MAVDLYVVLHSAMKMSIMNKPVMPFYIIQTIFIQQSFYLFFFSHLSLVLFSVLLPVLEVNLDQHTKELSFLI